MRTGIHTARPVIPQEFLQAKHKRPRPCIVIRQKTGNAPFSVFFRRIGSPTLKSGEKRTTFKSPEMPNDIAQQDANLPFLSPAPVPERQQPQKRAVLPGLPQPALVPQHASGRRPPPHAAALRPTPAPQDTPNPPEARSRPAFRHPAPIVPRRKPPDLPRPKAPEPPAENPARAGDSAASHGDLRRNSAKLPPEPIFRTFPRRPRRSPPQAPPPTSGRQKARPRRTGTRLGHKRDTR